MNKILYPVSLLVIALFLLSFRSEPKSGKSPLGIYAEKQPSEANLLEMGGDTFSDLLALRSSNKNLSFEVYSTKGERMAGNIYRYHKNGEITYEIGRGLKEGLYLIKMNIKETSQYYKLIRFGY
ncbi:MAG: hypothetical protein AAF696_12300 [Bacteroidota bacterium]